MFILSKSDFKEFNITNVNSFVECWSKYTNAPANEFGSKKSIDYFSELNLGGELSESNVKKLLRWKDTKYLTEIIQSGDSKGQENPRVLKVLENIDSINQFRNGIICQESFEKITEKIFKTGVVWRAFLYHISKPLEYPILDQHVYRVYRYHVKSNKSEEKLVDINQYIEYCDYFKKLVNEYRAINDIYKLKSLDSALMAYGQFLNRYDKN